MNTFQAAVDSCLTCHNDSHSLNNSKSKHGQLLAAEGTLPRPLPRMKFDGAIHVNHNNTYNLLPQDRMVKDVCMNCHGLEYSYRSIFDSELVRANFDNAPTKELQILEMIRAFQQKRG